MAMETVHYTPFAAGGEGFSVVLVLILDEFAAVETT
jgi:hypothetical protein